MFPEFIQSLCDPAAYPHATKDIRVIETHISWLLLTGDYAYKVKKPVNFGFLDFTSLQKRQHFCEEELRLNRRQAPDLYLEVVAITGTAQQPVINGDDEAFEYAVRMHQFDTGLRLDLLLQQKRFEPDWIDTLAGQIAHFHSAVPMVASDSPWGEPENIWELVSDNFLHLRDVLDDPDDWSAVQKLSQQTSQQFRELTDAIRRRKAEGHVCECHGDLHLANITLYNNELRLFDCIEFNLQFRWIDTICDLAFLLMDLEANGQFRWAHRLLNRYLELTGDYNSLKLLNFYKAYRAMVRAKVAMLGEHPDLDTFRRYLRLAQHYARTPTPALLLMHGLSGSGKSYISGQLVERIDAIRIRSDIERKRLYRDLSLKGGKLDLYGQEMNVRTYHQLFDTTREMLRAGYTVVVDATFIRQRPRISYAELAASLDVPFRIISCHCEQKLIEARLKRRKAKGVDASDADVSVMHQQKKMQHPLQDDELERTVAVYTDDDEALFLLTDRLRRDGVIRE
ncbi:bifunctional aminoglycoside phosphotransferase/ATP-binding protein [Marinobacterium rhizophilum]|uniref:AAA family ATPase n=1 Tax=Marinobacterium rhizophilum TaxID=420402 RepID=A0ABY5HGF2_9GAMM|nr:bifunctional aminoglycoside phosphotransferase/ATP-binding protein [Marinobacterium rhizophilum]UTW10912.1 AAA family ATPase [Marinobacterium rhizophilum]